MNLLYNYFPKRGYKGSSYSAEHKERNRWNRLLEKKLVSKGRVKVINKHISLSITVLINNKEVSE